jgi:hypothetical protein
MRRHLSSRAAYGGGVVLLASMVLAIAVAPGAAAAAPNATGFVRTQAALAPLGHLRSYTVQGTRTRAGCAFSDAELVVPVGWTAIERRDIAIDFGTCRKVVEEGAPTTSARSHTTATPLRPPLHPKLTTWRRGYYIVWFEDVLGLLVNSTETDITWFVTNACVSDGYGNGGAQGAGWSGWQFVSGTYTHSQTCASFIGTTSAQMKNSAFCSPVTVWANYDWVKATGYKNGTLGGSNSADIVNECLPLWKHTQSRIVATGNGGP